MDKKTLAEIGKKKGLTNKEHVEKDYFQDMLLFRLYSKTNKLVFKGGTALYKNYRLPRFSDDLDFNILEKFNIEKLVRSIADQMKGKTTVRKTKDSLLFKIAFKGILTEYNTLRIDVSTKNKALAGFDIKNYVPDYIDISPFSMRVLKLEEMVAEKIHALFARQKSRDLYDLFFLLRMSSCNKALVEKKLAIFGLKFDMKKLADAVSDMESLWKPELKPFVLEELQEFSVVRDYVTGKISEAMHAR